MSRPPCCDEAVSISAAIAVIWSLSVDIGISAFSPVMGTERKWVPRSRDARFFDPKRHAVQCDILILD
jgi:hypothetical protein